jgi:hypothetical protein
VIAVREARVDEYERVGELGFVWRPDRDVAHAEWNAAAIPGLPVEWAGQAFLAYSWSGPSAVTSARIR